MLGLLLALLPVQLAADTTSQDTVFYGGQVVRFLAKTEEVVLLDSAWVRYRDMTVYSDSIHYDTKIHRLSAFGEVLFTSGDQNITGAMLQYDLDTRKGMMRSARTEVENGFFWAQEVWLVRERVLNARRGYYTTCDHDPPHYCFYGPRTKLYMDDMAIAEPVVFKLFGAPVLAAPFWLVPVASKRKSGIMPFKVGNAKDQGWYAKNLAYYWVINDYSDATFYCDVMTQKGIQPRLEAVYLVNPYAKGSLQGSYIQEWDTRRKRYSLNATHSSVFFFDSDLTALADYQSDASYAPEYGEEQLDWLKQDVRSYAEVSKSIRQVGRVSARVENKTDFAQHRRYTYLPSVRLSFGSRPLPLGWNASPGVTFENVEWVYSDSAGIDTSRLADRNARATLGLSSPQYSLGGAGELTVSSGLGISENRSYRNGVLDDRSRPLSTSFRVETSQKPLGMFSTFEDLTFDRTDNLVDTTVPVPRYTGSVSGSFSLYRVYGVEAMGMSGLLHTSRPSIGLSYEPKVDTAGFFGRLEPLSPALAALNFAVANSFEAKTGEDKTKRDMGRVNLVSAYDLIAKHLSPLRADAAVSPFPSVAGLAAQVNAAASFDFDSLDIGDDYSVLTSLSWDRTLFAGRKPQASSPDSGFGLQDSGSTLETRTPGTGVGIRLGLNHTFGKDRNMLTGALGLTVPGWTFTLNSIGYNFSSKQLTDYSITVWKDLHCWEAVVNLNRLGTQWRYDFEVRIKKLPDVKFGKSTFRSFLPE